MPVDLTEVPVDELLKEVSRRLECTKKPERRMILIGEENAHWQTSCIHPRSSSIGVAAAVGGGRGRRTACE